MASVITLEGLRSVGGNEDRALADIKVIYNTLTYNWQIYIPRNTGDLATFLEDSKPNIELDIDNKEAIWAALDPKTREIEISPGEFITIDILKEEIVKADVPDYVAIRRNLYPPISNQLDAIWKGPLSSDYNDIEDEILAIKDAYEPNNFTSEQILEYKIAKYTQRIKYDLDRFARTREPYQNMTDACTYSTSSVAKLRNEGLYCIAARTNVWIAYNAIIQDVRDSLRTLPTTYAVLKAELPTVAWP